MVLVNPEDNRSSKTPHAGGFENPITEYNLPLDQANAQFNLEGNIPDNLGADYAPVTPEEQAAARKSVIDAKHDRTPVSWGKRVKIGVAALAAVGAAAFGIKAATSGSSEVVPTGTPPTATETANPTTASSAIESGATSTSVEVTTPTTVAENDPVKGGNWSKLSPEQQAEFSAFAAMPWTTMDQLEILKAVNTPGFYEFTNYIYENNVDAAIAQASSTNPNQAKIISAAKEVTLQSTGQAKVLHHELEVQTAYVVGKTDPGAGMALLVLAYDPQNKTFIDAQTAFNAFNFNSPRKYSVDTVQTTDPTNVHNIATVENPVYAETYTGVIPFKDGLPNEDRIYSGRVVDGNYQLTLESVA